MYAIENISCRFLLSDFRFSSKNEFKFYFPDQRRKIFAFQKQAHNVQIVCVCVCESNKIDLFGCFFCIHHEHMLNLK